MGVYTFSSKPTTPGEKTPDLLIRFQAVSRTQPCVQYRFMSVHSRTKLHQVRRYITKYFKNVYEGGFIFLCKTKEILKSDESKLTVFDILPKVPEVNGQTLQKCFQYPDVQYKKVWYNYDGKRFSISCACVIFLFERSKVSHWPPEVLREELSASAIDGFAHIPTDIMSWSGKLVECRGTPLHIFAAIGLKEELRTAIHQLSEGTTAKFLTDQRGATPLHYAAVNGNLDVCEIIVAGMGSEMIYHLDNWKRTPLHRALYRRKAQTITYLIQLNADVDTEDFTGNSCLNLLFKQSPKDVEFIVSKLETDCVDNRVQFCLLYMSMRNKNFSHVHQLAQSISVSSEVQIGSTLLHMSAEFKLLDVTKILVSKGFDKSQRDLTDFLPFHIACKFGTIDQIQILMYPEMDDYDVNKGLQLCIRHGHIKGCHEINVFRQDIALEETTVCMVMSTVQATLRKFKHKYIDEEPLKHFENMASMLLPTIKSIPDVLNTYVYDAALYGASETLILLKSLGASFNTCDFSGRSPLHEATQSNKLRCVQVLLKGGANPNTVDWRGSTPLHYACGTGNANIVKCLMENKHVKVNIKDVNGRTPLLVAAYYCRNDIVCYLLRNCEQVIDLKVQDEDGYGLLHFSIHLKESTFDLVVEKMSTRPKPMVADESVRTKHQIPDHSWIGEVIFTDFRAHLHDMDDSTFNIRFKNKPKRGKSVSLKQGSSYNSINVNSQFSLQRTTVSTLWTSREKEHNYVKKKPRKSPKLSYQLCSGCKRLIKSLAIHRCVVPSDRRGKKIKLKAFEYLQRDTKEKTTVPPFFLAVKDGNYSVMRKLRKLDQTVSTYHDNFGRNCLSLALDLKSLRLVKNVLELIPDIEKSGAVHRVVSQASHSKRDSTPLQLLTYLISIGCTLNGTNDTSLDEVVVGLSINNKNTDITKILIEKAQTISDKTMAMAASSGSADIVETALKKWRKNDAKQITEMDILSIAISSRAISIDVMKYLLSRYYKHKEHGSTEKHEDKNKHLHDLCKSSQIPLVRKHSLLGKLLHKNHPALKSKPRTQIDIFSKIGTLLLNHDPNLGMNYTGDVHIVCECLRDCIEMKCYDVAELLIKKSTDIIWKCELSDKRCAFQRHFHKKIYNSSSKKLVNISYLQNIILAAASKDTPENVLNEVLKYGAKFFRSDAGADVGIDLDILPAESRKDAEKIEDNMVKLVLTVLELIAGEKMRHFNVVKIWKQVPGVLPHIYLLGKDIDISPFVRSKEDFFLSHCYTLYKKKSLRPGTSVLHLSAGLQDSSALKMVIKATVTIDTNVENEDGVSPLDIAVTAGYWQNYKILMDNNGMVKTETLEKCCIIDAYNAQKILKMVDASYWGEKWCGRYWEYVEDMHCMEWETNESSHFHLIRGFSHCLKGHPEYADKSFHGKSRIKMAQDIWNSSNYQFRSFWHFSKANPYYADNRHGKSRLKIVKDVWSRLEIGQSDKLLKDEARLTCACAVYRLWEIIEYFMEKAPHLIINAINEERGLMLAKLEFLYLICTHSPTSVILKQLEFIEKHITSIKQNALSGLIMYLIARNEEDLCQHLFTKTLVSIGIDSYDDVLQYRDNEQKTALHHGARNGNLLAIQCLTSQITNTRVGEVDLLNSMDKFQASPLWYALSNRHWKCAQLLLIKGCIPKCRRATPDFDNKRKFKASAEKLSENTLSNFASGNMNITFGKRVYQTKVNKSVKMAYRLGQKRGNIFERKKQGKEKGNTKKQKRHKRTYLSFKTERSYDYKRALELIKLSKVAEVNGAGLIHVAYALGDQELISQIIAQDRTAFKQEDRCGCLPIIYAIKHGNFDIEKPNEMNQDSTTVKALIWKFMSTKQNQNKLVYFLTQLLSFICWRYASRLEAPNFSSGENGAFTYHLGEIIAQIKENSLKVPRTIMSFKTGCLYSKQKFTSLVANMEQILKQFFDTGTIETFLCLFKFLPCGQYTQIYNSYSCVVFPNETKEGQHQLSLAKMIKDQISAVGVTNIPKELLTVLLISGESWVFELLVDTLTNERENKLTDPYLLDLTIIDIIPLLTQSENENDKIVLAQEVIKQMEKILILESSLTLHSDVVDIAKEKQLWSYLEVIGHHTLIGSGVLSPVWQTVMAKAAESGQIQFMKSILSSLEVSKMTDEQKSCFTAFICLASLNGQVETVKYLIRNRIPLISHLDESPIKDLLGKFHIPSWGVLEYAVKGNSTDTIVFLLKCFRDDRTIKNSVKGRDLLKLAIQKGNKEVFQHLCQYVDKELGQTVTRQEIEEAYRISLMHGREEFCLQLLEQNNTSLVIDTDNRMSSLHLAAIHGMYSIVEKIIQTRPEVLNRIDGNGYSATDYAVVCGRTKIARLLKENKMSISNSVVDRIECCGWFRDHMTFNETLKKSEKNELVQSLRGRTHLTIESALEYGNDILAASAIHSSQYLIKANLKTNFLDTVVLIHMAAQKGCLKSLGYLCGMIQEDENVLTKVCTHEIKGYSALAYGITNSNFECVKVLLKMGGTKWQRLPTGENILHLAVKTEQLSIVQLVDDITKGSYRTEKDHQGMTPLLYAVALGQHHILAYLTTGMSLQSKEHIHHTNSETSDFTCLECNLDMCIGWSKLYLNSDKYHIKERNTRPINTQNTSAKFFVIDKPKSLKIERINSYGRRLATIYRKPRKELLLTLMVENIPRESSLWRYILISMGYKDDNISLQEVLLQLPSSSGETVHHRIKRLMGRPEYTVTLAHLSQMDTDISDLILSAAACGNTQFLKGHIETNIRSKNDQASLNEIAFAFGNMQTALFLHRTSKLQNIQTVYSIFHELTETLPLQVKWITGIEKPGNENWEKSISTDPIDNKLSMADLWVIANFPDDVVDIVCTNIDDNFLIPQAICGKKYTVDFESFRKNTLSSHLHHVTIQAYVASSHIYGRQLQAFTRNGYEKLNAVQNIKVTCEPVGPGSLPKIHIDSSGNFIESVVLTQTKTGTALMIDNSLTQRSDEVISRNRVMTDVLPTVSTLVLDVFERDVTLRIDWNSLESRRRTGNYDLLLKLLSGESSGNWLGGLYDVLLQCKSLRRELFNMFDQATVDFSLHSLSHIREVVVVYVDNLQRPEISRKAKTTSLSDILIWEFTYERGNLKYNRENFPLLIALLRYHNLSDAVYNSVYRIANLDTNVGNRSKFEKYKEKLTLEIDLKSFGIKDGTMINEKLCQGVSREVNVIAHECEAIMRLVLKAKKILLRNSPSVQGAGLVLQDETITISVCTYLNSQKAVTIERGQIRQKLEDIEDQQAFSEWKSEQFNAIKLKVEESSSMLRKNYGIDVHVSFDDKRIAAYGFQRYRRELEHPHVVTTAMMTKCVQNIVHAVQYMIDEVFHSNFGEYLLSLSNDNSIPDGLWVKILIDPGNQISSDNSFMVNRVVKLKLKEHSRCWWWRGRLSNTDVFTDASLLPLYTCKVEEKDGEKICWKHNSFESSTLVTRKQPSNELVSLNNRVYKIVDESLFQEVLSQLPTKINVNADTFITGEMIDKSVLRDKLSPDFRYVLANSRLHINTPMIRDEVNRDFQSIFKVLGFVPSDIEIDFQSFNAYIKSSDDVKEAREHTHRTICIVSSRMKTAFFNLFRTYGLILSTRPPCSHLKLIQERVTGMLKSIESVKLKHTGETRIISKKKLGALRNPILMGQEKQIEILFYNSPIDTNLKVHIKEVLLSLVINTLENAIIARFSNEMRIDKKVITVRNKYSDNLEFEEAVLWQSHLYCKEKGINLSMFHSIKVDGTTAVFKMKGTSSLEFSVSINEKQLVDSKVFRYICKSHPSDDTIDLFESDLQFLMCDQNSVRLHIKRPLNNKVEYNDPALYRINFITKSAIQLSLKPFYCDWFGENNIVLRFTIPDTDDKQSDISFLFNDKLIGNFTNIAIHKEPQSNATIAMSTSIQVKKDGWFNISVGHDRHHSEEISEIPPQYRIISSKKMIEPIAGSASTQFIASYTPAHIFSKGNNYIHSPIRITKISQEKYRVHVDDHQREILIKAVCKQCKQSLSICTQFQDIIPNFELVVNRPEDELEDVHEDSINRNT
ncbi:uncharacterized protein LOC127732451 [Mytilus californianus]|uniref:uncharacterized protein LOC127732451 n=1 Tax=Mytilus californianus TaxID=6549 RepID=UPI00224543FF|nr:uncharacterized protein LOC127732451 [Mytilus californianus]XP_052097457.1 uncharacterized protein LOC127732451 [Mytilus californianus]